MLKCISKMVSKKWQVKVVYYFSVYILKIKKKQLVQIELVSLY